MSEVKKRKLIEVALPLEKINSESAKEKVPAIRPHPRTLHLWWARRPHAAARALLFAQLVDDPSSHPDRFPTEEDQREERERLHSIIERLAIWKNSWDDSLLDEAHKEILKSTDGNPPPIVDPFAGGGTIPLEAQRLGLEAHASDLNPVAVLINKALIEIPPKFKDQPPVFPGLADSEIRGWKGAQGLAADVRAYGQWMRDEAEKRIGHLYPTADGKTVIAWIWARTVTCPNPACGIEMPLVRSWWLGKKKGKEAWVKPSVVSDLDQPSGKRVHFEIRHGKDGAPSAANDGTVARTGAVCLACATPANFDYLREQGSAGRMSSQLMAVVAEGDRKREYFSPTLEQIEAAQVERPSDAPAQDIGHHPRDIRTQLYGMTTFSDLFTNRQLVALTTFSDLVIEARAKAIDDGATTEYADAIATYLGLGVSRATDRSSTISSWDSSLSKIRNTFGRQAIPMAWDFAEAGLFSASTGNFVSQFDWIAEALDAGSVRAQGIAKQESATDLSYEGQIISTDPPYYDNIGYSDLSDFFYVWLRRSLRDIYPDLLSTLLVPKADELVANPYRHDGKNGAKKFFEDGFRDVFANARKTASTDFPITVYYAFKQSDTDVTGEASTGWETLLEGMIQSGWEITSTWPLRSEQSYRMIASGTNALASSIVLSLRPRPEDASTIDRRGFITALESELPGALRKLQQGSIAPVDLPQAAIGPGMAVFSRYSKVMEPDGSPMSVRSALVRINEILDTVLNEQEGDFDAPTRFAITWYRQNGYGQGPFGEADNLARARNTSVEAMDREGIVLSRAGKVKLLEPAELDESYDIASDLHISNWEVLQHLIRVLEANGISAAGIFLRDALARTDTHIESDLLKELAHLLYRVAEGDGRTNDAISFNNLVTSWPDILAASLVAAPTETQSEMSLEFDED